MNKDKIKLLNEDYKNAFDIMCNTGDFLFADPDKSQEGRMFYFLARGVYDLLDVVRYFYSSNNEGGGDMLRDNYIRHHAFELMKQLDYLDDNDKLEHLDELITMLSKRRESLRFTSKSTDRYEVKNIGGTYVIYKNGVRQKGSYVTERDAYDTFEEDLT